MKTNTSMRVAVLLMALVLMTSCFVSGTFAKYVTTVTASDNARVAYWGFEKGVDDAVKSSTVTISNLFEDAYTNVASSVDDDDVIAPGTSNSVDVFLVYSNGTQAPEVDYKLTVDASESTCDQAIQDNLNIVWNWTLPGNTPASGTGRWADLITALSAYSQSYTANTLPEQNDTNKITIGWKWLFDTANNYNVSGDTLTQDEYDTMMGNKAFSGLDAVEIIISVTATQVGADD